MKRTILTAGVAALPLLTGCTGASLPVTEPVGGPRLDPSTAHSLSADAVEHERDRWSWTCPRNRTRIIVPGMDGLRTAYDAAHFFSGKERAQLHRVRPGQRVAIVRGVDGLGPSRLHLYTMRGEWYVNQIKTCKRRR